MKISKVNSLIAISIMIVSVCAINLQMKSQSAQNFQTSIVIASGYLQQQFNSKIYENPSICTNGMLKLIQFNASKSQAQLIQFTHDSSSIIDESQIVIQVHPNVSPLPKVISTSSNGFIVSSDCTVLPSPITSQNYYNHVKFYLKNVKQQQQLLKDYQFSFLINCDRYNRHKKFQYGYLLIGLINAALTIGVALHSRIWSIKFNQKPLRILLTWKLFLLIMLILMVIGVTFYLVASRYFKLANQIIKYIGLVVSLVFTFICMNEILYLFRPLKRIIWSTRVYKIRRCQLGSLIIALILFTTSIFIQNWPLYTFLAGCICVGSIKMLYFNSMKQAFYSLAISVCSVTIIAVALHYLLPRSYNDYASQLSSPLFIQVPDLVDNLFKKCSWLPVVDIIVPGVLLSFLRTYDQNFSTGWGGVYTVTGNLSFLLATTIWIGIQVLYPFSVPFSLITYSLLLVSISIIAFKRNQLKTLWGGYFLQQNQISSGLLKEDQKPQFQIDQQTINAIRIKQSFSNKADQEESYQFHSDFSNPKIVKSALRTKKQTQKDQYQRKKDVSRKNNIFISSMK